MMREYHEGVQAEDGYDTHKPADRQDAEECYALSLRNLKAPDNVDWEYCNK